MVLDRRAGQRYVPVRLERARGARLVGVGVLYVLGLVEYDAGPFYLREERAVAVEQRVGGYDERLLEAAVREDVAAAALYSVVYERFRAGREFLRLAPPVLHYGGRADEQYRPLFAAHAQIFDERERLHRLAEAHVVGEARAHAEAYEAHEPREPFRLIGAQPPAEALWRVHLLERRGAGEQRAHRVYPRRARDGGERRVVVVLAQRGEQRFAALYLLRHFLEGRGYLLHFVAVDDDPAPAQVRQRRLELGERRELLLR